MKTENICITCETNCCRNFFIILEDVKDKDWIKWLSYHRGVTIKNIDKHKIQVWFDLPCEQLGEDNRCRIYNKRPKMCRKFKCEKLKTIL